MKKWMFVLAAATAVSFLATGCCCAEKEWRECEGKKSSCCTTGDNANQCKSKKTDAASCPMTAEKGTNATMMQSQK